MTAHPTADNAIQMASAVPAGRTSFCQKYGPLGFVAPWDKLGTLGTADRKHLTFSPSSCNSMTCHLPPIMWVVSGR